MNIGELSLIEALVWPLFILLGIVTTVTVGVFGLVYYWQEKTRRELDEIRTRLRAFQSRTSHLQAAARPYGPDDPEPFGSLDQQLERGLKSIEEDMRNLHLSYGEVRTSSTAFDVKDWKAIFQMPSHWFQVRQNVNVLLAVTSKLESQVQQAEMLVDRLERQGWEVAITAREHFEHVRQVIEILTLLRSENVHDRELDAALSEAEDWEEKLNNRVPLYFLSGDEASVLAQADKHTIVAVHRTIIEAAPVITSLLEKAQDWKNAHSALIKALDGLTQVFRDLSNRLTELESSPLYPLEWDQSRGPLAQARQQLQATAADQKRRTLEEITRDLQRAEALSASLQKLSRQVEASAQQHAELKQTLSTADIQQGEEWVRNVKKLVSQVEEYDPSNWSKNDAVETLPEELEALVEHQRRLPLLKPAEPVKESELPALVESARGLAALHHAIRPRVSGIQARLNEIKETERNARDGIARTRALLHQADSLAGSNDVLAKAAGGEMRSILKEVDSVFDEIQHSSEGLIDKKAQRANNIIRKAEQLNNRLLDQINIDLAEKKDALSQKVHTLAKVAALQDPALEEARKLLSKDRDPAENEAGRSRGQRKSALSLSESVPELKRKNEAWQRCIAVLRALEDIEAPVLDRYGHAEQVREETAEFLDHASEVIPETRGWPPTQQMITSERRQFKGLEAEWQALRQEPVPALQVVSKLSDLTEKYQHLANRMHQMIEKAEDEQARVLELEQRLEEAKHFWQTHLSTYSDNYALQEGITELLTHTDQEMDAIQKRYERGSIPYPQVVQNVRMLCQKLEGALVPVDNRQVIDISGVVQKRI